MRRPKWMPTELFAQFIGRWGLLGGVKCVVDGCVASEADMTIDHIVPRHKGGKDELSNLQPMCRWHNQSKGPRPDNYWAKTFYWDRLIDLSKLRVSQSDFVYNVIAGDDAADFFSRPFSEISGKLFAFLQIVGAGKTIASFVVPFALNRVIRARNPNAPRCDKLLIVTKGQALRGQIARELRTEPVDFGIISESPRVVEIERGSDFLDKSLEYDVAVMCPNLLWPDVNVDGEEIEIRHKVAVDDGDVLRRHPVKWFDEFHYAYKKIQLLAQTDVGSLIFGGTASPIEGSALALLPDIVRMSCYGYEAAARNDGSMKLLSSARATDVIKTGCVDVITAEQQEINGRWVDNRDKHGNLINEVVDGLATVKAVADGVMRAMHTLDHYSGLREKSPHREMYIDGRVTLAGIDYASHAIITVENRRTAEDIAEYLNEVFTRQRDKFPLKQGWRAMAVHGTADDRTNKSLKQEHPFFYYMRRGKLDASCCRIIVVVDMAVEGMNNRFVNILGVAQNAGSRREIVQRIGRALRSTHTEDEAAREIMVPCAVFDKVFLITHEAFKSKDSFFREGGTAIETIDNAIDFILNMDHHTSNLIDLSEYMVSDDEPDQIGVDADAKLSRFDRFNIFHDIAIIRREGRNPRVGSIVKQYAGGGSQIRKDYVRAYATSAKDSSPETYRRAVNGHLEDVKVVAADDFVANVIRLNLPSARESILDDEREYVDPPSVTELVEWMTAQGHMESVLKLRDVLSADEWQAVALEVYMKIHGSYRVVSMSERMAPPLQEVHALVAGMEQGLRNSIVAMMKPLLRRVVCESVLYYLQSTGIKSIDQLDEGGSHDRTGITHVLRDRVFADELRGYVLARMLQQNPNHPIFDLMPDLRELEFFKTNYEPSPLWDDLQDRDAAE